MNAKPTLVLGLLMALACCGGPGGCAVIGWTVAALTPPKKVEALYKLPKRKAVLVFVDDVLSSAECEPVKAELTRRISKLLIERNVVSETIPYERVLELSGTEPAFDRMPIAKIGRELGAQTVLYVHVDRFSLREEATPLWRGELETTVRVVDADLGRLWPTDQAEGYPVGKVQTPAGEEAGVGYERTLTRQLAEQMADRIVKLFYDHRVPATTMWGD